MEGTESRFLTLDGRRIRAGVCKNENLTGEALAATRRVTAKYNSLHSVIESTKAMISNDKVFRQLMEELEKEGNVGHEQTWTFFYFSFRFSKTVRAIRENCVFNSRILTSTSISTGHLVISSGKSLAFLRATANQ